MKLVLAIVRDNCAAQISAALSEQGFGVTRISSSGGFWRRGNVTLLAGVDDDKVDQVLEVINTYAGPGQAPLETTPPEFAPHRATIFVLAVRAFEHY
jgi:uncharacterized protein YaaQ